MFQIKFSILLLSSIIFSCFIVSSCKLKPLYAKKNIGGHNLCKNFDVKLDEETIEGQKLKLKLSDLLNQTCIMQDNNYNIEVKLAKSKQGLGIQRDREITRFNMLLTVIYKVHSENDDKVIYSAKSRASGAFDAQVSDYGTYAIEQDTVYKLAEELAEEIALKITTKIIQQQEDK